MEQEVVNQLNSLRKEIKLLSNKVDRFETAIAVTCTKNELIISEELLRNLISNINNNINLLNEKLSIISIPQETRYYLEENELLNFRNNTQKLTAMIADVEELYKNIVAYVTNIRQ